MYPFSGTRHHKPRREPHSGRRFFRAYPGARFVSFQNPRQSLYIAYAAASALGGLNKHSTLPPTPICLADRHDNRTVFLLETAEYASQPTAVEHYPYGTVLCAFGVAGSSLLVMHATYEEIFSFHFVKLPTLTMQSPPPPPPRTAVFSTENGKLSGFRRGVSYFTPLFFLCIHFNLYLLCLVWTPRVTEAAGNGSSLLEAVYFEQMNSLFLRKNLSAKKKELREWISKANDTL